MKFSGKMALMIINPLRTNVSILGTLMFQRLNLKTLTIM